MHMSSGYDLIGIMETSYDWIIGREGKDAGSLGRTGREEKEVVLHS